MSAPGRGDATAMTRVVDRIRAIRHLYGGNPDVKWLADRLDVLSEQALDTADFLESYTDESELARRSPTLVEIMRSYAKELRDAVADAAHEQQAS